MEKALIQGVICGFVLYQFGTPGAIVLCILGLCMMAVERLTRPSDHGAG